ncbi:MAG: diguanylate cyclase [Vicinamibacteria bacterium]
MPPIHPDIIFSLPRLGLIALLLAVCFVVAARFRPLWGVTPIAVLAGLLQVPQTLLAINIPISVLPGISVNPGSVVFFPATLFAILLVYVLEDEVEAKRLIYGLLLANVALAVLILVGQPLMATAGSAPDPASSLHLFRVLIFGAALLGLDSLLLIRAFEWFGETVNRNLYARAQFALGISVAFDSLVFPLIAFIGRPQFWRLLFIGFLGKFIAAVFYSLAFVALLRWSRSKGDQEATMLRSKRLPGSVTYKDRFKDLQKFAVRDALTGVFNRAYFDHELKAQTERTLVRNEPLLLLLIDLDSFKKINDTYGHPVGDRVLATFGEALRAVARQNDTVCRYGGEEFAVLIGGGPPSIAPRLFDRTVEELARLWKAADPPFAFDAPKFSVGGAAVPGDSRISHELLSIADSRLYESKGAGGNRLTVS